MKKKGQTKIHLLNQQNQYRLPLKQLTRQLNYLAHLEPLPHSEINFIFLTAKAISTLNRRYLNHSGPTDVITFQHGEIFICPAIAYRQSKKHQLTFARELLLYAIHGWLHLHGFNDKTSSQSRLMHLYQNQLLEKLSCQPL